MPSRPKRFGASDRPKQRREYDKRRGTAASRGYNGAWARASRGHKAKHPLCIGCLALGKVEPVYVTDHVVPGTSGTPEFWNSARWQSACKWHHDVVKQRLEEMYARGAIGIDGLWLDSPVALDLARRLGAD